MQFLQKNKKQQYLDMNELAFTMRLEDNYLRIVMQPKLDVWHCPA